MKPLLEVSRLTKYFGGLAAVKDVDFDVYPGEIFGLIGPNGAGKTTIFNLINGFYRPTSGVIKFKGRNINGLNPHKVCKLGIGRTFQLVKPLLRLTVLQNVMVGAFARTESANKAREEAEKLALEIARFPQTCLRNDRLSAYRQFDLDFYSALKNEFELGLKSLASPEMKKGIKKFIEGKGRGGKFE